VTQSSTPPVSYKPMRQVLSIEATAEHLGVQVQTVRRWIAAGHLVAYRVGPKLVRIDAASIEAMLRPANEARAGGDDVTSP